jgi:hypothetical protein
MLGVSEGPMQRRIQPGLPPAQPTLRSLILRILSICPHRHLYNLPILTRPSLFGD